MRKQKRYCKEEELAKVLLCVNTETKNSLLSLCLDTPKTLKEIIEKFSQFAEIPFKSSYSTLFTYFQGFVENDVCTAESEEEHTTYTISPLGLSSGRKIAAFTLIWAVDNQTSIYPIFGPSHSHGKSSSPYNRINIISKLDQKDPLRCIDLEKILDLDHQSVNRHCIALRKEGIISFDSANTEQSGWAKYSWIKGKSPNIVVPVKNCPNLTRKVASLLSKSKKSMDYHKISELLGYDDKVTISNILASLEAQGFAVAEFKGGEKLSSLALTEKGKLFARSYIQPIKFFWETGSGLVDETWNFFSHNPRCQKQYAQKGVNLYAKESPQLNRKSRSQIKKEIYNLLQKGPLRPKDIADTLKYKKDLVLLYLRELYKKRNINRIKKGQIVYYSR